MKFRKAMIVLGVLAVCTAMAAWSVGFADPLPGIVEVPVATPIEVGNEAVVEFVADGDLVYGIELEYESDGAAVPQLAAKADVHEIGAEKETGWSEDVAVDAMRPHPLLALPARRDHRYRVTVHLTALERQRPDDAVLLVVRVANWKSVIAKSMLVRDVQRILSVITLVLAVMVALLGGIGTWRSRRAPTGRY